MKYNNIRWATVLVLSSAIALTACSDSDGDGVPDEIQSTTENVTIQFAAQMNGADFACGQTYTGIGTGPHDFMVTDFRMYIHDAHIHDELTGEEYEIELTQDGVWQLDDVAMLDFEDATNGCTGTAETNTVVKGSVTVPATVDLSATEVCFEVGLPEDKNHIDEATAASPLNASGMLWAWKIGRKYIRIDGVGDPSGTANAFNIHLGAQGCPAGSATEEPVTACTVPNTFEVCVENFDVENSVIAVNPAGILEGNDVSVNLSTNGMGVSTAKPGCQSFIDDDDCEEVMPRLGLNYDYGRSASGVKSVYAGEQKMFSKQ